MSFAFDFQVLMHYLYKYNTRKEKEKLLKRERKLTTKDDANDRVKLGATSGRSLDSRRGAALGPAHP